MVKERIKGNIFGAVIGDSLGTLVEEMGEEEVKKSYGGAILGFLEPSPNSVCPYLKKGDFSHESQIFLTALEVYGEKGYFDENLYIEKLTEWVKDEKRHRYPSGAHLNAALSYAAGAEPEEARVKASDIDGAIPAAASGLFRWDSPIEAYEEGRYIASLTHKDDTLTDLAGVLAYCVSKVVGGGVVFNSQEEKLSFVESLRDVSKNKQVKAYLDLVGNALRKGIGEKEVPLLIGNGSFAPEAFSAALFIFLKNPNSFRRALLFAVNSYGEFGGDTDAIAFITGSLSGGFLGINAIPKRWIECLRERKVIELTTERFLEKAVEKEE